MTTRRLPPRAQTTPIQTLHSLLTAQEADIALKTRPPAGPFLLKFNELPPWQQDNHYILTKYRPESNSYFKCFQSLLYLHNESVNIHSHLLGAFLFYFTSLSLYAFERYNVSTADVLAFSFFFVGAVVGSSSLAFEELKADRRLGLSRHECCIPYDSESFT